MDPRSEALWTEELLSHAGWIRALAERLVADSSVAEDVVQQTWLAALTHPPSAARSLRPWLGHVLRTQIALRRRSRRHRRDREVAAARSEPLPSAEELAIRTEAHERLVRAVRTLREPYRSAIILHYYDGLSAAEIARRRGVPDSTVRSQIRRGLERLRADLDTEFGDRRTWCLALAALVPPGAVRGVSSATKLALATALGLAGLVAGGLVWLGGGRGMPATHAAGASPVRLAEGPPPGAPGEPRPPPIETQRVPAPAEGPTAAAGGCVVRVVDAATGEPLPDFDVRVLRPDGQALDARTDAGGELRLDLPGAAGAWELVLVDDARLRRTYARTHGSPIDIEAPRERRELAADITELVVAAPAGPTYLLDLDRPPRLPLSELRAHLRAAGPPTLDTLKWAVHVAPVRPPEGFGAEWVRFAAIADVFLGEGPPWVLELESDDGFWSGSSEVDSITGRHPGRVRVALEPRARLRGRVVDALGPVTDGVLIELNDPDGALTHRRTDTDGQGGFVLEALEPGAYQLAIESPRHAPYEVQLLLEGGAETVREVEIARAQAGGAVEGILASRTGGYGARMVLVLADAEVETRRFFASAAWEPREGRLVAPFAFDDVPRGRYVLRAFSCDDQLPWQPRDLELEAPQDGILLECQDDLETTSHSLHAVDAASGELLGPFTLAYSIDGGPEVVLGQVRPVPSGPDEPAFEWRVRFAGVTWARRSGPAQIPHVPRGSALRWGVFAEGHAPAFGDETAFIEQGGLSTARVVLERGWGCRLSVVADDAARRPLAGVELWADGRPVAATASDGLLECRLAETPRVLELRQAGWPAQPLSPAPVRARLRTEVRLPR